MESRTASRSYEGRVASGLPYFATIGPAGASKKIHGSSANSAVTPIRSSGGLLPSSITRSIAASEGAAMGMRSAPAAIPSRTIRISFPRPSSAGWASPPDNRDSLTLAWRKT